MRHAVFVEPGRVEWREAPDLKLQGPRQALVRPLVVGRCDLDVAYVQGRMPMPAGAPIGHEIIGEVVALGDETAGFEIGQRVFVPAQISCGHCDNCRRGLTGRCLSVPFGASYGMGREGGYGGGLADLVRVPYANAMLTPVPSGVDPASLIGAADMATDAWRAVAPPLARHPGARVLVIGGMPPVIGLYAVGLATALGAGVVHYLDEDPVRGRVAKVYGATLLGSSDEAERYDIVVVAQCTFAALELAFQVASPGGTITSVAPALDGVPPGRHANALPQGRDLGDRTAGLPPRPRRRTRCLGQLRVSSRPRSDGHRKLGRSSGGMEQRHFICSCCATGPPLTCLLQPYANTREQRGRLQFPATPE